MTASLSHPARSFAAAIALAGLATVVLQTTLNLAVEGSPLIAFAKMMRYFTLWTNFFGALLFASIALGKVHSSRVMLALATAYAVVALVYHGLLAADHHPAGLDWWTNLMFHTVLPATAIAWWFAYSPAPTWRCLPGVMLAPVVYTVFALIVGAATGFYPYFFLDQPKLGWPMLLVFLTGLALFFFVMAALLKAVRRLGRGSAALLPEPTR